MTSLRAFARQFLLACLLVFALAVVGAGRVEAKVYLTVGHDGVEGDPGDSAGAGGSGGGSIDDVSGQESPVFVPVLAPQSDTEAMLFMILPGPTLVLVYSLSMLSIQAIGGGE